MPESFVQDAADRGYPPDWDGITHKRELYIDPSSVEEVTSTLSFAELKQIILRNIWEDCFYSLNFRNQCYKGEGFTPISVLDGLTPESENLHVYCFDCITDTDHYFSARILMEVLRESGLPLLCEGDGGGWVAWDSQTATIRVDDVGSSRTIEDIRAEQYAKSDRAIANLLLRSHVTSDHGQKPLLIAKGQASQINDGLPIEFLRPEFIPTEDLDLYEVAFLNSAGVLQILPLERLVKHRQPIYTRCCTYDIHPLGIRTRLDEATLIAGAYKIATSVNPNNMGCYRIVGTGSIFQSAIFPVELPTIYHSLSVESPTLEAIQKLQEHMNSLGACYLTTALHPLESYSLSRIQNYNHWVTRIDLYEKAVQTIEANDFHINFGYQSVEVKSGQRKTFSF